MASLGVSGSLRDSRLSTTAALGLRDSYGRWLTSANAASLAGRAVHWWTATRQGRGDAAKAQQGGDDSCLERGMHFVVSSDNVGNRLKRR